MAGGATGSGLGEGLGDALGCTDCDGLADGLADALADGPALWLAEALAVPLAGVGDELAPGDNEGDPGKDEVEQAETVAERSMVMMP